MFFGSFIHVLLPLPVFSLVSIRKREVLKCISYVSSSNKSVPKQGYREIQRGWSCLIPLKDLRTDCHIIWHALESCQSSHIYPGHALPNWVLISMFKSQKNKFGPLSRNIKCLDLRKNILETTGFFCTKYMYIYIYTHRGYRLNIYGEHTDKHK